MNLVIILEIIIICGIIIVSEHKILPRGDHIVKIHRPRSRKAYA